MNFKSIKRWLHCGIAMLFFVNAHGQNPDFHIYLCFGQSNMCGAGTIETKDKTVDSRFQMMEPIGCTKNKREFGKWYDAVPPLWGCDGGLGPSDYFGRTMVEKLPSSIKVGVIVVAAPGCDIALFAKTGYQGFDKYNNVPSKFSGSAYAWLLELAKSAQKDGVIKGMLLHQGETNSGQTDWPGKVKKVYDDLLADLKLNASTTPLLVGELLYQNQGGACGGHNSVIATMPKVITNSHVISANGLAGKDQYHFTTESNRTFGKRYAEKMLSLLTTPTIHDAKNNVHGYTPILPNVRVTTSAGDGLRVVVQGDFTYRITTIHGTLVSMGKGKGECSVATELPPGMYLLSVLHKTGMFTKKIIAS